jgi:hypothetical protein
LIYIYLFIYLSIYLSIYSERERERGRERGREIEIENETPAGRAHARTSHLTENLVGKRESKCPRNEGHPEGEGGP